MVLARGQVAPNNTLPGILTLGQYFPAIEKGWEVILSR